MIDFNSHRTDGEATAVGDRVGFVSESNEQLHQSLGRHSAGQAIPRIRMVEENQFSNLLGTPP